MYSTRVRRLRSSGGGLVTSRSIDVRKAARVLPLPVGRADERVPPGDDRRPPLDLSAASGTGNDAREPGPHGGREGLEHRMIGDEGRLPKGCHRVARDRRDRGRPSVACERRGASRGAASTACVAGERNERQPSGSSAVMRPSPSSTRRVRLTSASSERSWVTRSTVPPKASSAARAARSRAGRGGWSARRARGR